MEHHVGEAAALAWTAGACWSGVWCGGGKWGRDGEGGGGLITVKSRFTLSRMSRLLFMNENVVEYSENWLEKAECGFGT